MTANIRKVVINEGKIPLHDGRREYIIDINSIIYCKAGGNYTDIFLVEDTFRDVRIQIGQFVNLIDEHKKILDQPLERIGRSFIFNLDKVRCINPTKKLVVMHASAGKDIDVPVKRADARHLMSRLKNAPKDENIDSFKYKTPRRKKNNSVPLYRENNAKHKRWSDDENEWCNMLLEEGYSINDISVSVGRSKESVKAKMNNLLKKTNRYNEGHIEEKFNYNVSFANAVIGSTMSSRQASILDLYCGYNSFWNQYAESKKNIHVKVTTNDSNLNIEADYNEKAEQLIHKLYYEGNTYDIIDIDPFGSPYECIELSVKMAKKGLCVTFGDLKTKQYKTLDFFRDRYDIESLDDLNVESLIAYVQKVGRRNKKTLEVFHCSKWRHLARVWFRIK